MGGGKFIFKRAHPHSPTHKQGKNHQNLAKTLLINTPLFWKMYKGIRKEKKGRGGEIKE